MKIIDNLNPDHFEATGTKDYLPQVNSIIMECTTQIAKCYAEMHDYTQCSKYASMVLERDPQNLRALYFLGKSQAVQEQYKEALDTLSNAKNVKSSLDVEYLDKITKEVQKVEAILNRSAGQNNSNLQKQWKNIGFDDTDEDEEGKEKDPFGELEDNQKKLNVTDAGKEDGGVDDEEGKKDENKKEDGDEMSQAGYFLGSVISTSAISMAVTKYFFKVPLRKSFTASIGMGILVGGVSLLVNKLSKFKDNDEYGDKKGKKKD